MKVLLILAACAVLAGCGATSAPAPPAPDHIVSAARGRPRSIVLTATGAQAIGVQTAPAGAAGGHAVIPLAAVVYDPNGSPHAFAQLGRLSYSEIGLRIDRISGGAVYLRGRLPQGTRVVTVGAEELYGVETGVLAQT